MVIDVYLYLSMMDLCVFVISFLFCFDLRTKACVYVCYFFILCCGLRTQLPLIDNDRCLCLTMIYDRCMCLLFAPFCCELRIELYDLRLIDNDTILSLINIDIVYLCLPVIDVFFLFCCNLRTEFFAISVYH